MNKIQVVKMGTGFRSQEKGLLFYFTVSVLFIVLCELTNLQAVPSLAPPPVGITTSRSTR